MIEAISADASATNTSPSLALTDPLERLLKDQSATAVWQTESLTFVPMRGSWFANSEADFDLDETVNKFLDPIQTDKKVLLLLGDSGSGKSLYTQRLVTHRWQSFSPASPIPLWISLPSLKDPTNKAITETLARYGFANDQIESLIQTRSFIFILDAYDEIHTMKNLYVTNQLDRWNAKVIFTCRKEYLYAFENYKILFTPYQNQKPQMLAYEEMVVRLFNPIQIQLYLQQYVKSKIQLSQDSRLPSEWLDWQSYQQAIEEIPALQQLIKTPFLLKLAMEALPIIVDRCRAQKDQTDSQLKRMTQASLYDVFIEQWFIRQEQKLKAAKQIPETEDIKHAFWEYAKSLAQAMHQRNLTQVVYEPEDVSTVFDEEVRDDPTPENPWNRFFNLDNKRLELLFTACLIRQVVPHHYEFIHSSLIEYFLTKELCEKLSSNASKIKTETNLSVPSSDLSQNSKTLMAASESSAPNITEPAKSPQQDYFNQRLITKEANTLQFLVDRVLEQTGFKQVLLERIYASRNNPNNRIAAANAITILNLARVPLTMDLSGVIIDDADLTKMYAHGTNFSGASLHRVKLQDAYLCNVDFSNSEMNEVDLGQLPPINQKNKISAICYSKDGHYLAIGDGSNIVVWDQRMKKEYARMNGHTSTVRSLAFSPNNKILASGGADKMIRLWEISTHKMIGKPLVGHISQVVSVVFSSDDMVVSGSSDDTVGLWNVSSQQLVSKLTLEEGVNCIALSADNKVLAIASCKTIQLRDMSTLELIGEPFVGNRILVSSVAFSPDNKLLATGGLDKSIQLWEVATQQPVGRLLKRHTSIVNCVAFSPDGKLLASGGVDKTVYFWDVANQQSIGEPLTGHMDSVGSIVFSPDGEWLASGSDDKTVRFNKIPIDQRISTPLVWHTGRVLSVAFSPDGKLLASGRGRDVYLWEVSSRQLVGKSLSGHKNIVNSVVFNPKGGVLASGSSDNTIRLWNVLTQQLVGKPLEGHTDVVWNVTFSFSGKILASGSEDKTVRLWELSDYSLMGKPLEGHTGYVSVAFAPDDKSLVSGSGDMKLRLWEISTQQMIGKPMEGHTGQIRVVTFSPDGKVLASGSWDQTVRLWDTSSQQSIGEPLKHPGLINSISFSSDGMYLVSGCWGFDKKVYLWSVTTKQCLSVFSGVKDIHSICFSPDNYYLAIGNDDAIGLWENQATSSKQPAYRLVWYAGSLSLAADSLNLKNVRGLSEINLQVLTQHGADIHKQASENTKDCSKLSEDNYITVYSEPEAQKEKTSLASPPYSTLSSNRYTYFQPTTISTTLNQEISPDDGLVAHKERKPS